MDVIKVEPESDKNMQMGSDVEEEEDLGCSSLKTEGRLQHLFSGTLVNSIADTCVIHTAIITSL
jgi:hypothetical protein